MPSRYVEPDWTESNKINFQPGVWEHTVDRVFAGKRGKAVLREIELALLQLPEPKLYDGKFCEITKDEETGVQEVQACVLGAWALMRKDFKTIDYFNERNGDIDLFIDINESAYELSEKRKGMSFTMAWELMYQNDEYSYSSPEDRYTKMLSRIRSHLPEIEELKSKLRNIGIDEEHLEPALNLLRKEILGSSEIGRAHV